MDTLTLRQTHPTMKLTLVVLLASFLANISATPNLLPCDRPMDGTANIMGVTPQMNKDDRSIDSVGGVECSGQLEAGKQYDVAVTVPAGFQYALEAEHDVGGPVEFETAHPNGCTSRTIGGTLAKFRTNAPGSVTFRLMAASGKSLNVGAAPECTYTVVCPSNTLNVGGKCYHEEDKNDKSFSHTSCNAHCEAKGMAMACMDFDAGYDGLLKEYNQYNTGDIALANPADAAGECVASKNWESNDPNCRIDINQQTCSEMGGLRCVCQLVTTPCTTPVSDILPDSQATFPDCGGPSGTCASGQTPYACLPTCVKREEITKCIEQIPSTFTGLPDDQTGCAWVNAAQDHVARCFGAYGCCADWDASVAYWKSTPDAGFENCEFLGECIEGCSGDGEGAAVTGPCYATCDAEAQKCINDLIESVEMTCAGVSSASAALADCFAGGDCCSDMTKSVELWESMKLFEDCPAGTFPQTCGQQSLDDQVNDQADDDEETGGTCPAGGMISTDENDYCIPTCANREAVAKCLDEIGNTFMDIPSVEASVAAGKPCDYIDVAIDHAARCFGSYECCSDWDATVTFTKTLGYGFETCTFPSTCIEGCQTSDDAGGGSVTGPCFPTCSTDVQMCVGDILSLIGESDDLCAEVKARGPAVADCFAAGGCCDDMMASVELWEAEKTFEACGSTSPFPQECKEAADKVLMSVNLPLATVAEFTQTKRTQFRQGLATAAGVTLDKVVIKKVTQVNDGRRRLLATSIKVDSAIAVADAAAATALVTSDKLSEASLTSALAGSGLGLAPTIVTAPQVVSKSAAAPAEASAPLMAAPSVLLLTGAVFASLALNQ